MSSNLVEEKKYYDEKRAALAEAYGEDTYVVIKDSQLWGLFKSAQFAEDWAKKNVPSGHALIKRLGEV